MESEWRKFFYYPAIKINKFVIGQNGKSRTRVRKRLRKEGSGSKGADGKNWVTG